MGGSPRTSKDSNLGITLSRAHYGAPSLQLGIRGPPRRPHGVGAELEEAFWQPRNSQKNQQAALVTPGDPRAAVAAKGSCPQAARGVTALVLLLCSDSPGGGAMSFQGCPAWVPLLYGARRVLDMGGHNPRTSFLPKQEGIYEHPDPGPWPGLEPHSSSPMTNHDWGSEPRVFCNPQLLTLTTFSRLIRDVAHLELPGSSGRVQAPLLTTFFFSFFFCGSGRSLCH